MVDKMDATYSEVFDLCTSTKAPTLLALHSPISLRPHMYLNGLFNSFRYFRYKGCDVSVVPASSNNVDPAFISERPTGITNAVHPADILNPILDLRADGVDLGAFLDDLLVYYGVNGEDHSVSLAFPQNPSEDDLLSERLEALYYQMLTSPGVDKHDINSAFQVHAEPTIFDLSSNIPLLPSRPGLDALSSSISDTRFAVGTSRNTANGYSESGSPQSIGLGSHVVAKSGTSGVMETPQIFTNGTKDLGWMPTITSLKGFGSNENGTNNGNFSVTIDGETVTHRYTTLPKLLMHLFIAPKATLRQQFYRLVVHHHFEFAEFHSSLGAFSVMMNAAKMSWNPLVVKYPSLPGVADAALKNVGVPAYDMDGSDPEYATDETLRSEPAINEYQSVVTNVPLISYSDGVSGAPSGIAGSEQLPNSITENSPTTTPTE